MLGILNIWDEASQSYIELPSIKGSDATGLSSYPIGSYYISSKSTSPAELFGGTWEQIKDTFLLAAGDTYEAGSTGGEAEVTLTADEMPIHSHDQQSQNPEGGISYVTQINTSGGLQGFTYSDGWATGRGAKLRTTGAGGSQPHTNMPPYKTVYVWERIE